MTSWAEHYLLGYWHGQANGARQLAAETPWWSWRKRRRLNRQAVFADTQAAICHLRLYPAKAALTKTAA